MRTIWAAVAACMAVVIAAWAALPKDDRPPAWAFVVYTPAPSTSPPDAPVTVPGSLLTATQQALDNPFRTVDWFPEDHGTMPGVVERGRSPKLWACTFCHGAAGVGGSDSAVLAGLPAAYVEAQLAAFRSGLRGCAVPKDRSCSEAMQQIAANLKPAEVKAAAAYFAGVAYRPRLTVVEADMVPKTTAGSYFLLSRGGTEPIGERIIELPDDPARERAGDWHNPVTVFVPPGSLARGKVLVEGGAQPCASCHGAQLHGTAQIPPLAGRSPTYIVRQLYDFQYGFRRGAPLMAAQTAHLTATDRIAVAAYVASMK